MVALLDVCGRFTMKSREIMTVPEVAEYLRCHESSIYRMLKNKQLPAFKVGADWRFNRSQIDQWMLDSTVHGDGKPTA